MRDSSVWSEQRIHNSHVRGSNPLPASILIMPKVNQKAVTTKLEEFAKVQAQIKRAEKSRNKKLDPIIRKHNEEMKPILEKFEKQVEPLRSRSDAIEKEIKALIEVDRDADGNPKPILITSENAVASVEKKEGMRIVDAKKYFDFVKNKSVAFWKSLKVTIKDAEPIVGKNKIDDLSEKKTDYVSTVKLK